MIPNNTLYIESCYYAESEMNLIMWTWSTKLWSGEGAVGPVSSFRSLFLKYSFKTHLAVIVNTGPIYNVLYSESIFIPYTLNNY
ncbi:hypothetical protein V1477_005475 [Vespula maculifrons]|uniref:Uncharacterized protein n=1 Tax=Vespula maculifrons TaxID=7453 RepID=A0ABD2CPT4_VESMC